MGQLARVIRTALDKIGASVVYIAEEIGLVLMRSPVRRIADGIEWVLMRSLVRRIARGVGLATLLAVVVVALFVFLNWYIAPEEPGERKDLVLGLAQILGGTALLSGLYFTWRTLQVNREGQITDRFTRAIDQLGATNDEGKKLFEIRLGAIYALERIAKESPEDHWPIMEILTAYVRQHAHRVTESPDKENAAGDKTEDTNTARTYAKAGSATLGT